MKRIKLVQYFLAVLAVSLIVTLGGASTNVQAASTKKTKISLWTGLTGVYEKNLQKITNGFNKSQNKYHVVLTSQGTYDKMNQKVMAAAKSNNLPVLGMALYTSLPDYKHNGFIQSLDPLYKSMPKKNVKDIYASFRDGSKVDGNYYSVPLSKSVRILYYNKDILKKYNLAVPKTWNQLRADGQKLKEHQIYAYGFDQSFQMEWEGMLHAAGVTPISGKKVAVNSQPSIKAANFVLDMVKNGTAKSAGSDVYWTQSFVNGQSAFYIGSSAAVASIKEAAKKSFNWGAAVVPSYEGKSGTEVAGNDLVLFKGASKAEKSGAYKYLKYLLKPNVTAKWAEATGYLPVSKKAVASKSFQQFLKDNPYDQAAVDSLPDSFSQKAFVGFNQYYTDSNTAFDSMLNKKTPAKKALDNLAKQTKTTLAGN
ncbi:sugar ABC transporter substrate-binding protein [Liquorilactobacillus ghanensis DSM 18630]|uniref:Sugar ABC transporter substrate-binding protein n=1 Tax=Liquorilactobacillus ghanensis DSM 18630 TaxID=1423750 RepID=A0A0R1VEH5_9LACO|nr:ABC transporter substrate-binding protein [Liquorilactobacillus ghanensis]KRM03992.1 sugar ABC transporter substrate-binding protein [Liquorilactobacillus ghanensis DSM 18630]